MPVSSFPPTKSRAGLIVWCALLVGTLDILAAFASAYMVSGRGPEQVLRYIASGFFGSSAFTGPVVMVFLGLLFHFIIAFIFTAVFYLLHKRMRLMQASSWLTGIVYGIVIWLVMTFIVLPLSHTPKTAFNPAAAMRGVLILIGMIGLPLAFIMKRYIKS